jgi:glutamine amidotransferase PdxT
MMTAFITVKSAAMTQQMMSRTSITVTAVMTDPMPPWIKKTFVRTPLCETVLKGQQLNRLSRNG